ncbi:MAG TPA: hypothetical protein VEU62_09365, partial [Bryobacterales bacterium]|nr:hypothetical protein [Bryobacterales bacterium]
PWWMLNWRWAVPALAGVAIVGSVVYYQREQVLERRTAALPAAQTAAAPSPPAAPAVAPAAQPPAREEAPSADLPRRAAARARKDASPLPAAERAPGPAPASSVTEAELRKKQNARGFVAGAPVTPPAAAPVPAPGAIGGVAPTAEKTAAVRDETSDAASAKVTAGLAGARAQSAALTNRLDLLVLPGGARPRSLLEHDSRLWAVCDGGRIFRSADHGRTWTSIESPTTADLVSVKWDAERNLLLVTDRQGAEYRVKP